MTVPPPTLVFVNFRCATDIAAKAGVAVEHNLEVVVADNSGEYDGPGQVIRLGENVGFGLGCNAAIAEVSSPQFCLHNPDVTLDLAAIGQLSETLELQGSGLVAPALDTPNGLILNGYGYPTFRRHLRSIRGTTAANPSTTRAEHGIGTKLRLKLRSIGANRFASGALIVGDTTTFRAIGGFDPRFVLYGEDLDLCHRTKVYGAPLTFRNDIVVSHERGGGSPTTRPVREVLRWAGIETFVQLHGAGKPWQEYREAHRRSLHALGSTGSTGELIGGLWEQQLEPVAVAERVSDAFRSGLMDDRGRKMK